LASEVKGWTRLVAGSCLSNFGCFCVLRRWLRVGLAGGSGGDVVFWVDQRVGLKVAWKSFGVGRGEGLDEARRRFLSFELWMLLRLAKAAASGVGWRWWW
jgi:hypothetical protein